MGRLFDESGEPLYSCWAKKGLRRYRYLGFEEAGRGTAKPDTAGGVCPPDEWNEP